MLAIFCLPAVEFLAWNMNPKGVKFGLNIFGVRYSLKYLGRIESTLNQLSDSIKVREVSKQFKGQKLFIGFDELDMFKGVSLKLLAFEQLFIRCPTLQGKLVLLQIINPPRSDGWCVEKAKEQAYTISNRINERFGFLGYKPVIIIEGYVPFDEKATYYALAECCILEGDLH